MAIFLGVDAGGTKTLAVVANRKGQVLGLGRAGSANFQLCGPDAAQAEIKTAIEQAYQQAKLPNRQFDTACLGVSGADRPCDFETIRTFVQTLLPGSAFRLENDTVIALRAGTDDGVGIALIAGTGANAIGRCPDGRQLQVGGLGPWSGDHGSAGQLGEAAIQAAIMGVDGRGAKTVLGDHICRLLDLSRIEDIIEFAFADTTRPPLDLGRLAPLVFAAAAAGDSLALQILTEAGHHIAKTVEVLLTRLFPAPGPVSVVFGGSVFQHGAHPQMLNTITALCQKMRPGIQFVRLATAPVLGALLFAYDDADQSLSTAQQAHLHDRIEQLLADDREGRKE